MNKYILLQASKIIWGVGFIIFVYLSHPYLWGAVKFIFTSISSLVSDRTPSASSTADAHTAFAHLFGIVLLSLIGQLFLLATPFIVTGSGGLIAYYNEREEDYIKNVSKRIELSKQIADASEQLQSLHSDASECRAQLARLWNETKSLTDAVTLSRETLTAQIKQTSKLNNKGDF